jgi:hypothetical protein
MAESESRWAIPELTKIIADLQTTRSRFDEVEEEISLWEVSLQVETLASCMRALQFNEHLDEEDGRSCSSISASSGSKASLK